MSPLPQEPKKPLTVKPKAEEPKAVVQQEAAVEIEDAPLLNIPMLDLPEEDEEEEEYSSPVHSYSAKVEPVEAGGLETLDPEAKLAAMKLLELIGEDGPTEILMNGPKEIIYKKGGQRFLREDISFRDNETYHKVINEIILPYTNTKDRIGSDSYLVEGQMELPYQEDDVDGRVVHGTIFARVHIVAPPAVTSAKVTIAKKAKQQMNVRDLAAKGTMSRGMADFLIALARGRANIVLSGLSGSGKTTLLEALSHEFDDNDRVIVAEDTSELSIPIDDCVYLQTAGNRPGADPNKKISLEWLVAQANRMRPDRIIVGEVRGAEMLEFLSAANSGADGSMTTLHASSPRQALDKMLSLAMKSQGAKNEYGIQRDIANIVQIIVQTALIDGRHIIAQIEEVSTTIRKDSNTIASNTIFEYNRHAGVFESKNRPSEQLISYLNQRGVSVDNSWFNKA